MGLLNKIYGRVQAGRCLFNIFCDDEFEQSKAGRQVFRNFDDGEVEIVVLVHVDDILAHAQATMERSAAELGETFVVKSMMSRSSASGRQVGHQLLRGYQPSQKRMSRKLRKRGKICRSSRTGRQ